jgi:methylglyoxal synthase
MRKIKRIALVAHDNRKNDLAEWVGWNWEKLINHELVCTGTTGSLIEETLKEKINDANDIRPLLTKLKSGPLGGDQQLGAMISEGMIDFLFFLWDPMQPQPHDVDVKALNRIAVLYNVPNASNRATADFIISSPLFDGHYERNVKDYSEYINRMK